MATLTPLSLEEARKLASQFGLTVDRLVPIEAGSVNSNFILIAEDGGRHFGRIYEEQDLAGARADVALLRELHALGVPSAAPLFTLCGEPIVETGGKAFAVTEWVEGEVLRQTTATPAHLDKLGAALARVHTASSRLSVIPEGRFGPEQLLRRLDGIEGEAREELAEAARQIRAQLSGVLARQDANLPSGVIHGDLFRDNVLWRGDTIAALIDFESACKGAFIFDIMVCLEAWAYHEAFVPELILSFLEGYQSVRVITEQERAAARAEGALVALRFATTRITDFSMRTPKGEEPKRSYRRFIDRFEAIEAGVVDALFEQAAASLVERTP